jgi:16S rRNA (uracil1498-N3)-methyltransferase
MPLLPQRSVVRIGLDATARLSRWRHIVQEAAEQCRRGRIPDVTAPRPLAKALEHAGAAFMPWEKESALSLAEAAKRLRPGAPVSLYIGPEGGFEEAEVAQAAGAGVVPVTLGPRILRAETAAVVALTIVLEHLGELAPRPH